MRRYRRFLLGRTLDDGWVDRVIQPNAKCLSVPPGYRAGCTGTVGQIDYHLIARPDIGRAFAADPLFGHVTHQYFHHAKAGMKHLRLEQPPLAIM